MGTDKVILSVTAILALMGASGVYVVAETAGLFAAPAQREDYQPVPEAA
jgi:hypothetical protein